MEDFFYRFLLIYRNLPLPIRTFVGSIYNSLPRSLRYGSFYEKYSSRIQYFTGKEEKEIKSEQIKLLLKQVNNAIKTIPFYSEFSPVNNLLEFEKLPIINKEIIISNFSSFYLIENKKRHLKVNTGGSSGNPLEFFLEKHKSRAKEKAHFDWFWGQFGYTPKSKILMLRGNPLKGNRIYEYNPIDNILNISSYNLNEKHINTILKEINNFQPEFINAYPSSLKILTGLLETQKENLSINIKSVFLGSEQLFDKDRTYFFNFYNAPVVSWYGHTERLIFGGNCGYSNEFHFHPSYGYFELLDSNNNQIIKPGIPGRIIATGFDNSVMPFLRYDTADIGILSQNNTCKCGFKGKTLTKIEGRVQDYLILNDNTRISLTALYAGQHLEIFKKIRDVQIIQVSYELIKIKIVPNSTFTLKDSENIISNFSKALGGKINIKADVVENIPKTVRGKNIFFISKIKEKI